MPRKKSVLLDALAPKQTPSASAPTSEIYCLKCKAKTGTKDVSKHTTTNGRHMLKGICATCGKKKSKFVKA